ncbi:Mur ligase family protein [Alcanivorax sp.]|uniref:bifunctional folylpolyglutamate synthase/dihydrofolate synthase n=1 Tax=Alcanivorax sp. TaxID=1872427 RepID=UPI0032D93966
MTDVPLPGSLPEWLRRIESMHPADIELGLDRLRDVATRLAVARFAIPVITVAGTNGKGSTLRLMAALAEQQGRKVCLYTSPHLHVFNERIRLPDGLASDAQLCAAFAQVELARADVPLTYFEFTTLAALWLFKASNADLLLLEVGLGGRLDAVNIVEPDVSVVTSVGLDHQDWLGSTREAIAAEKCGIARPGKPLVYGEEVWPENLVALISTLGAIPVFAGRDFHIGGATLWLIDGESVSLPEAVRLGADNLATACQALSLAGVNWQQADLTAVAELGLFGRCEQQQIDGVSCWFDVGHNLPAVQRFLRQLPDCAGTRHLVFGMMADKPINGVMALFEGMAVHWYLAAPQVPRAASTAMLQSALPPTAQYNEYASVSAATHAALSAASVDDQVIVFGSFYTVAEAREPGTSW